MNDDGVAFLVDLERRLREIVVDGSQSAGLSQAARETALGCLEPRLYANKTTDSGVISLGLGFIAQKYRSALSVGCSRSYGYRQLCDELEALNAVVDMFASKLKGMTPEAAMWIEYPEIEGDPRNERIRALATVSGLGPEIAMQIRGESCPTVVRLEAFSGLLRLLVAQATEAKDQAPLGKQYLTPLRDSPAFLLFYGCGKELLGRDYSLKYLRPIAAAIHEWATNSEIPVSIRWEQRAENHARAVLKAQDKKKNQK